MEQNIKYITIKIISAKQETFKPHAMFIFNFFVASVLDFLYALFNFTS